VRAALIGTGVLLIGYAVVGAVLDPDVALPGVAIFLAAVLVLHDAVFLPLVLAAGTLAGRLRPRLRTAVQVAGLLSLPVLVVGLPLAAGFGRRPDNPSALPLPYGRNLLLIVGLIWLTVLLPRALRRIRKGSESSTARAPRARDG
jgi:hypothetical protein